MAEPIDCRLLGPLEVVSDGRPVQLGGTRPRLLLVTLVLEAGRAVPTDRLVDAVWGDQPPSSVRSQVAIHVSALRRAFAAGGRDDVIETVPDGYRLRADAVVLDAHVAERRVEEARELATRGRQPEAVEAYGEALARWRGQVLTGLDSMALAPVATRLEELRLTVVEERADLQLATGRHHDLSHELTPLVTEHPLRERLRAQLMLALARAGRPADALEVYREGRRLLVEQLGLEPGPELRQLEQAVLVGDLSAPAVEEPVGRSPARQVPSELPGDLATFTGRADEVRRISALVAGEEHGTVAIVGPGGIGKSTLAVHVAHEVADRFPDGQLYVNLQGATPDAKPLGAGEVLAEFLRSLGVATAELPADEDTAVSMFRSLTDGRRLLVVLDNAADAQQVRRLLPGCRSCAVLVTSRRMLTSLDNATHRHLGVLSEDEALALLARIAGRERVDAEPGDAARVVEQCGRLPLALAIAGARIAARRSSMGALADRLDVEHRRLGELAVDDQDVRASFLVSYRDLDDPGAARMFRLLGLLDGHDVGVAAAAALAGVQPDRAEVLLDRLVAAQLAASGSTGRYGMHDLLRLFARERAWEEESDIARRAAVRRALHCYVATSTNAALLLAPSYGWRIDLAPVSLAHPGVEVKTVEEVNFWIETEFENLLAAANHAAAGADPVLAVALAAALDVPLEHRGRWREQLVLSEIAERAAERTGEPLHLGLAYNDLGWALFTLGRHREAVAFMKRALEMWRSAGHGEGEALSMHGLGVTLRSTGNHEEALEVLEHAGALAHQVGNYAREATCLTASGLTYQRLGRFDEAVDAHRRGVAMARQAGTWRTETIGLGNLAEGYRLAGQPRQAVATFREALAVGRAGDYGGTYWEAEHLWGLGRAQHDLGVGGRASWLAAAAILLDLGLIGADEHAAIARDPVPETPTVIVGQL